MSDRNLEKWVEKKLENGVSRERIKSVLENSGNEPSIVDDVESPFDSSGEAQNAFEPDKQDESGSEKLEDETSDEEQSSTDDKQEQEDQDYEFNYDNEETDNSGFQLPKFSLPSFSLPSISFPTLEMPDLSLPNVNVPWRLLFAALFIGVVVCGGSMVLGTDGQETVQQPEPADELDQRCPDVGVRIATVSASRFQVDVEGRVSRGPAEIVIELYNNGNMVAVKQESFDGVREFTFNELSADSVVMRPVGCQTIRDSVYLG